MKMRIVTSLLLWLGVLPMVCVTLQAQSVGGHAGVILANPSGRMVTRPLTAVTPAVVPTTLYTIYSNLGPKHDVYDLTNGTIVDGPIAAQGVQWIGVPFTPTSNAELTEIEVALGYVSGFNGVTISLNADAAGLPGNTIHTWNLRNLFFSGGCCKLTVAKTQKGLKVSQGTQYWVVASTNTRTETTYDLWNFNYEDAVGSFAFLNSSTGGKWQDTNNPVPAFGVFGVKE